MMQNGRLTNQRGFTLIELVIIIVILGILAAVAIPKYQNLSSEAQEASARGSLGALRSGVTIFYANQAVSTGVATWPGLAAVNAAGTVMAQAIPANPYCTELNFPDSIVAGATRGTVVGTNCGWAYDSTSGEIWLNTSTTGVTENNW